MIKETELTPEEQEYLNNLIEEKELLEQSWRVEYYPWPHDLLNEGIRRPYPHQRVGFCRDWQ